MFAGICAERIGACLDTEGFEKGTLLDGAVTGAGVERFCECFEVHMGGEVGLSGIGKRIDEFVVLQCLEAVTCRCEISWNSLRGDTLSPWCCD